VVLSLIDSLAVAPSLVSPKDEEVIVQEPKMKERHIDTIHNPLLLLVVEPPFDKQVAVGVAQLLRHPYFQQLLIPALQLLPQLLLEQPLLPIPSYR